MAGRAKENLSRGSLKYLFVYLKVRIFKCGYRILLNHESPIINITCTIITIVPMGFTIKYRQLPK